MSKKVSKKNNWARGSKSYKKRFRKRSSSGMVDRRGCQAHKGVKRSRAARAPAGPPWRGRGGEECVRCSRGHPRAPGGHNSERFYG